MSFLLDLKLTVGKKILIKRRDETSPYLCVSHNNDIRKVLKYVNCNNCFLLSIKMLSMFQS